MIEDDRFTQKDKLLLGRVDSFRRVRQRSLISSFNELNCSMDVSVRISIDLLHTTFFCLLDCSINFLPYKIVNSKLQIKVRNIIITVFFVLLDFIISVK